MRTSIFIFILFLLTLATNFSFGQGCSDAGICTLNPIKNTTNDSTEYVNQAAVGVTYGVGDFSIGYLSPYIEYSRVVTKKIQLTGRIVYTNINGELSKQSGLSDVFISGNYQFHSNSTFIAGFKIPFNYANRKSGGRSLPMNYQTSLGTFDLLAGLIYSKKKFTISVATQIPITQNCNEFIATEYEPGAPQTKYPSTNKYIRKPDIIIRVFYTIKTFKGNFHLIPTLLPIYHISEDQYTDENGQKITIKGSEGITLNAVMVMRYFINKKHSFELSYGRPFIARDIRPDGLTRSYVAGLEYRCKF